MIEKGLRLVLLASLVLTAACGEEPMAGDSTMVRMAPCPDRPNCISSDADDDSHYVAPFQSSAPARAWTVLRELVAAFPRTRIVEADESYLRAEVTSRVFRFVDDLEFQLRSVEGTIAVRSASRVGYSDLGANRRRIEKLRAVLRSRGVLE